MVFTTRNIISLEMYIFIFKMGRIFISSRNKFYNEFIK